MKNSEIGLELCIKQKKKNKIKTHYDVMPGY